MVRVGIAMLALLGLAACAGGPTASAPPGPRPLATAMPISPDQDFLNRAATGTGNEIALGELGQQRGYSASVRAFGAHIAAEHTRAHASLMALARRLALAPTETTADLSGLAALAGPEFDRQFIADQVKNQRDALALFNSAAQTGLDPRLRHFAREWIGALRRDLARAENIAAGIGALALR